MGGPHVLNFLQHLLASSLLLIRPRPRSRDPDQLERVEENVHVHCSRMTKRIQKSRIQSKQTIQVSDAVSNIRKGFEERHLQPLLQLWQLWETEDLPKVWRPRYRIQITAVEVRMGLNWE